MKPRNRVALEQLEAATLDDLQARFPDQWQSVGARLVAATETRRPEALAAFLGKINDEAKPWHARLRKPRANLQDLTVALPHLAAARMAKLAAEQVLRAAATQLATGRSAADGDTRGRGPARLRLGLWSGTLIQRLMFARGLERKPISMTAFRWLWPLIPDRRLLMPLVQPRGIYCFYSRPLIATLATLLGQRSCLEVAAGDGTLTRFLAAAGVTVHAVDDHSWAHAITYPAQVERMDATMALKRDRPAAVICSFPPPGNAFEQHIFRAPSVDLYVVITTRHRFAAGDWQAYDQQTAFDWAADPGLSRLVLPPEVDPAVLVFRRRA
jgi:hypothetical protein